MSAGSFIKESIFKTKTVAGVEIIARPDSTFVYHIQVLVKKGKGLVPAESFTNIRDKSVFLKTVKELKCPVVINYQGKGIIHRAFQDSVKQNFTEALNRVVPSGNENEFHIQLYNGAAGNSFVSILRKHQLDELLKEFIENKIDVIGLLLGSYHLELILPLTEQGGSMNKLRLPAQELIFEDGSLREMKNMETDPANDRERIEFLTIDNKEISSLLYPALAAAMIYFIPLGRIIHNNKDIHFLEKEFSNKKAFVTLSRTLIAFLLVLTLGNFFLFNGYYKEQADLEGQLAVYENSINAFDALNTQLKNKEEFIEASGLQNGSRISYYTDRILYDMPQELQLSYFSAAPMVKKAEKDSVIRFDPKKVLIKGSCLKSIALNEWLKLLKTKDFVADAVLENYNQESDHQAGKFDVAVTLK
ncbi:MAG: hypothetical protein K0S33_2780 [Bacteroidetes bacterium]|jgi:hypothetical protein|nr:hypothetical protein [Bacteroidota bacterium]